jgi:hypothetical protein
MIARMKITAKGVGASQVNEAAKVTRLPPARLEELARTLDGGVFHVVEKSMKAALLDAAQLLRLGRKQPRTQPGETAAPKNESAHAKLEALHEQRVRTMTAGFAALSQSDALTTLKQLVDARFDAPERDEGRRSYRWTSAVPLISYTPDREERQLHETRRSVGRVELSLVSDDVIVVVTRRGLREVGGFGLDTRAVDPARLAAHGISLELLEKTLKTALKDAGGRDAGAIDVPMSEADRLATP